MSTTNSTSSMANPLTTSSSQMGGRGRRSRRMAKGSMRASRAASRSMALAGGRRRKRRGGQAAPDPSSYSDASEFVRAAVGSPPQQWDNVFKGPNLPNGNEIVGLQGQNATIPASLPQSGNMNGGKRRTKKGGYWSQVTSTALVPFGLWAAQNRFSKRRGLKHGGKTRKHRK